MVSSSGGIPELMNVITTRNQDAHPNGVFFRMCSLASDGYRVEDRRSQAKKQLVLYSTYGTMYITTIVFSFVFHPFFQELWEYLSVSFPRKYENLKIKDQEFDDG